MPGPTSLAELRVLDLSRSFGGAFCSRMFAGFGADVISIEPPGGHPLRRQGPFKDGRPHAETGAPWLYLGAGKRSVTLDVETATGCRLFREMVEEAAVIIESFSPGHMAELGLDIEALKRIKRRIVLCSITPYGQHGPRADWRATNLTSFASGGQMSLTGEPIREPLVNAGEQAEVQAGFQAFAASAVAAVNADVYEVPQHIDISAQECQASALELYLPYWSFLKFEPLTKRRGNILAATIGIFPAREGHIGIHLMPRNFQWFAKAAGKPELLEDERFKTQMARLANNDALEAIVYEWALSNDAASLYREAGAARVPVASVHSVQDLFDSEQLQTRDFFDFVDHPVAGEHAHPGAPVRMSGLDWTTSRAPLLGEHNEEFYRGEMGLSGESLARLSAAGAV
jgi:crotonobetainyl-CoA:carnitine CoA-transferase CaiB-like acyl-CoA transferase